jgi:hypothetical protein
MFVSKDNTDWNVALPFLRFAYNKITKEYIGKSPFYLLHGRHPVLPIDAKFDAKRRGREGPSRWGRRRRENPQISLRIRKKRFVLVSTLVYDLLLTFATHTVPANVANELRNWLVGKSKLPLLKGTPTNKNNHKSEAGIHGKSGKKFVISHTW